MRSTYSLGTIWGVRLGLNWSVLVLLGLVMWMLATAVFPETNPGLSSNAHFAMAVVASLAFFGSILLHELGHAVQAKRDGMEIEGITLWLFGGVARFTGGFPSANAELRIAAAGPAVSAALAGIFIGGWFIPGIPEGVSGVLGWLGLINVALLAFNLLPALPLDGGRILRAAIWRWRGDYRVATRVCARVAQVIAVALIAVGLLLLVTVGGFSGLWLTIIAWFLLQAARAELAMAEQAARLPGVADLMDPAPITVEGDALLSDVVRREGWPPPEDAYPVLEAGHPVGLLMLDRLGRDDPGTDWMADRVDAHMEPRSAVATLAPADDLVTALAALHASREGHALVIEGDRLVGMLSRIHVQRIVREPPQATSSAGTRGV